MTDAAMRHGLDGYLAALSFWVVLTTADGKGEAADEVRDQIVEEFGEGAIMRGLALVCTRLRHELINHAAALGCDCGLDEWLERFRLEAVEEFG